MATITFVLVIAGLVCLLLAAFGVNTGRVSVFPLGAFFIALAWVLGGGR